MPYIFLEASSSKKGPIQLQIRPKETLEALIWLTEHNPAYKEVKISQENVTFYENCNGMFTGCMTLTQNWVPEDDEANAAGPMTEVDIVDQIPEELLELNNPIPETVVPQNVPKEKIQELMKDAIARMGTDQPEADPFDVGEVEDALVAEVEDALGVEAEGPIHSQYEVNEEGDQDLGDAPQVPVLPWPKKKRTPISEFQPG